MVNGCSPRFIIDNIQVLRHFTSEACLMYTIECTLLQYFSIDLFSCYLWKHLAMVNTVFVCLFPVYNCWMSRRISMVLALVVLGWVVVDRTKRIIVKEEKGPNYSYHFPSRGTPNVFILN
jgi:hypothetical protein